MITQQLIDEPSYYDVFQAIRLIAQDLLYNKKIPAKNLYNHIQLTSRCCFGLSSESIQEIKYIKQIQCYRITLNHTGLMRLESLLPTHYLETILTQQYNKQYAFSDFISCLDQHIIPYNYHAWLYHQPTIQLELSRNNKTALDDIYINVTGSDPFLASKNELALIRRYYAGLLSNHHLSKANLIKIIHQLFNVTINIASHQIRRHKMVSPYRFRLLPCELATPYKLGKSILLGSYLTTSHQHITITIGPISMSKYIELYDNTHKKTHISMIVKDLLPAIITASLYVLVHSDSIRTTKITHTHQCRLGITTWLLSNNHYQVKIPFPPKIS